MKPLLLLSACLLPTLLSGRPLSAAPFPRLGCIVRNQKKDKRPIADIGRRASPAAAKRAALRMFARMFRLYPQQRMFQVNWQTLDRQGQARPGWAVFMASEENLSLMVVRGTSLEAKNSSYWGVTRGMIRSAARHRATTENLPFYGAWNSNDSVSVDLGVRASYDAGSRATMRFLARRLRNPRPTEYKLKWSHPTSSRTKERVEVTYNPFYNRGSISVQRFDKEKTATESYQGVKKWMVIRVGRRSGRFRDVVPLGAQGFSSGKLILVGYRSESVTVPNAGLLRRAANDSCDQEGTI